MKKIWERIEKGLEDLKIKYPEVEFEYTLNPGAKEEDFEKLEKVTGLKLDKDFKDFYKIHNGEEGWEGILAGEELLSIDRIISEYRVRKNLFDGGDFNDENKKDFGCEAIDKGIKSDFWWNPKWLPLTADGGGNGKMIDFDPSEKGKIGQIIQMWHDDSVRQKYSNSLREYLEDFAKDLENGKYALSDDYGLILEEELDEWEKEEKEVF
ncbi:glucan synthase [Candidatus Gracilibacteria bacterium]|nr:MAG: glucan synthase [Candidatus Gracilibacteria bacterium]